MWGFWLWYDTNYYDTNDKLPDNITLKNAVILRTYVIKDGDKFHPQLFLKEALYDE